ncbi:MAG: TolC family protein, partial [Chitinophagaceae bacterium]|nr:TolC family protein [Chitinophagaceae bacterium]
FNNFRQKVLEAYQEVLSYLKGIKHYKKIVALNQAEAQYLTDAVDISNDLYLSGYASYLEVITAQKGVLESELNRTASQNKLLQATLDLYRSLGGGWK